MQLDDFNKAMTELEKYYNKSLSEDQREIWFKKIENFMSYDVFKAIDQITSNERYFPTPQLLINAACAIRDSKPFVQTRAQSKQKCAHCKSSGVLHATKQDDNVYYIYTFNCNKCTISTGNYPVWDDEIYYPLGFKPTFDSDLTFDENDVHQVAGLKMMKDIAFKLFDRVLAKFPKMKQAVENFKEQRTLLKSMNQTLGLPEMPDNQKEFLRQQQLNKYGDY